jgi:DNA-binding response OmpR family regulator
MQYTGNRILVADDDEKLQELLHLYLTKEGFDVIQAKDGVEALEKESREHPSLILLDIMMPRMDGLEVCRELRRQRNTVPIIILSAKGEDYDRILGLELGADDYMTKPFHPREAVARIKAVLRRANTETTLPQILYYPDLEINMEEYRVMVGTDPVSLTYKEMELLWYLASHPLRVFTREQLLERVWGYEYSADTRTVDTHIKRLRKKLYRQEEESGYPWEIKTVWGVGYKFEVMRT